MLVCIFCKPTLSHWTQKTASVEHSKFSKNQALTNWSVGAIVLLIRKLSEKIIWEGQLLITKNRRIKCSVKDAGCMMIKKNIFHVNIQSDFKQPSVMHAKRDGADIDRLLFQAKAEDQKKDIYRLKIIGLRWEMVSEVTTSTWLASFESQLNMYPKIELYTAYINVMVTGSDPVQMGGWMNGFYAEIWFSLWSWLYLSCLHNLLMPKAALWRPSLAPSIFRSQSETSGGQCETWRCKLG